jgi:hypothetical protein
MVLSLVGCSYTPPGSAETFPVTRWEGKLLLGGVPLQAGWISLYPLEGTLGDPATAPIDADGCFRFAKAPVGSVAVRVTLPKSTREELSRLRPDLARAVGRFAGPSSPLRADTSKSPAVTFDLLR